MLPDGDVHVHTWSVVLPAGEVLVHIPAAGILVDEVDGVVVGTHDLLSGVVLDGRDSIGPLVEIPGTDLLKVLGPGVLLTHAAQSTDGCGGVPGSLVQLEMVAEQWLGMGMVTGVWSGEDLRTSSLYIMTLTWSEVLVISLTR